MRLFRAVCVPDLFEVFGQQLLAGLADGDRSAADELLHAVGFEQVEERLRLGLVARLLDDDVLRIDLQNADIVLAHEAFDVAAPRHLVEGDLLPDHLVGGVDKALQHIDLLFDLPCEQFDALGAGPQDDRVLVDSRQGRFRGRDALDIDVAAGEDRGDLVEQPHLVLRKYGDDVLL